MDGHLLSASCVGYCIHYMTYSTVFVAVYEIEFIYEVKARTMEELGGCRLVLCGRWMACFTKEACSLFQANNRLVAI